MALQYGKTIHQHCKSLYLVKQPCNNNLPKKACLSWADNSISYDQLNFHVGDQT